MKCQAEENILLIYNMDMFVFIVTVIKYNFLTSFFMKKGAHEVARALGGQNAAL